MISTIESESTSRSSAKDLSSWTSSAGTPATSLTISARSARISSVVAIHWLLFSLGTDFPLRTDCSPPGPGVGPGGAGLRQGDHLTGVHEPGAEPDDQAGLPAPGLARLQQGLDGQRDRGGRRVALEGD